MCVCVYTFQINATPLENNTCNVYMINVYVCVCVYTFQINATPLENNTWVYAVCVCVCVICAVLRIGKILSAQNVNLLQIVYVNKSIHIYIYTHIYMYIYIYIYIYISQ